MSAKDLLDTIRVETPCEASWDSSLAIITLKALANSSPGLLQPWEPVPPYSLTNSERVREVACAPIRQRFQRYDPFESRLELVTPSA